MEKDRKVLKVQFNNEKFKMDFKLVMKKYNRILEVAIDTKHMKKGFPSIMVACKQMNKKQVDIFNHDGVHDDDKKFVYYTDNG